MTAERIGLRRPEFQFRDGYFVVVLWGPGDDILKLKSQNSRLLFEVPVLVLKELNKTQRVIIKILMEVGEAKTMDLAKRLGLSRPAIHKALTILKEEGLVKQSGKTRDATYNLAGELKS